MTATLIWNDTFTYQQPLPVTTTFTVTYSLSVPSFTPVYTPFLFVTDAAGPAYSTGESLISGLFWRPASTGVRVPSFTNIILDYGLGIGNWGNFDSYYLPTPDDYAGGTIEVDVTYKSFQDQITYVAAFPDWWQDTYNFPNFGLTAYLWDCQLGEFPFNGGFSALQGLIGAVPTAQFVNSFFGPTDFENWSIGFPTECFDPAWDSAWAFYQQTPSKYEISPITVDENSPTAYSTNQITTICGPDMGQIGVFGYITEPGTPEVQIPFNNEVNIPPYPENNYEFVGALYLGTLFDIISQTDFQSPNPVTEEIYRFGTSYTLDAPPPPPLPWSIELPLITDMSTLPTTPYSFLAQIDALPDGIFGDIPMGYVTLIGFDADNNNIYQSDNYPWNNVLDPPLVSITDLVPEGADRFSWFVTGTNNDWRLRFFFAEVTFGYFFSVQGIVAWPVSGPATYNLQWYQLTETFDSMTDTFVNTYVPLGDPITWGATSADDANFNRVNVSLIQSNTVPTISTDLLYYQIIAAQEIDTIPNDSGLCICLDQLSVQTQFYSGGTQTYTQYAIPGQMCAIYTNEWEPFPNPPLPAEQSPPVLAEFTMTNVIASVDDDNTMTLGNPVPWPVGISWNYPQFTTTITGTDGGATVTDIPDGATHVIVDLTCDIDPSLPPTWVTVVGIDPDGGQFQTQSGQFIANNGAFDEQNYIMQPDFGFSDFGDSYGPGTPNGVISNVWVINSEAPLHRICQFNVGRQSTALFQTVVSSQVGLTFTSLGSVDLSENTFNITYTFFRFFVGEAVLAQQDFSDPPTIANAPDSIPGWQDQAQLLFPSFDFAGAQFAGDFLPAYNTFVSDGQDPIDTLSGVAVLYGDAPGANPGGGFVDEDNITSTASSYFDIIFRTFPQSTCLFLGSPAATGYSTETFNEAKNTGPPASITLDPSLTVVKMYTHSGYSMALMSDGSVWCSGLGTFQGIPSVFGYSWLEFESVEYIMRPLSQYNLPPMVDIAFGTAGQVTVPSGPAAGYSTVDANFYMLDNIANLWVFGVNAHGQLGTGDTNPVLAPQMTVSGVQAIHAGLGSGRAWYITNGQVYVCGVVSPGNIFGQPGHFGASTLGLPMDFITPHTSLVPTWTLVPGLNNILQIADWGAGISSGYVALDNTGTIWGWLNDNQNGILGITTYANYNANDPTGTLFYGPTGIWVPLPDFGAGNNEIQGTVGGLLTGNAPALYVRTGVGNILMTGQYDQYGSAGDGVTIRPGNTIVIPPIQALLPVGVPADPTDPTSVGVPPVTALKLAISQNSMGCIASDGNVYVWGNNANGFLGLGTTDTEAHPTPTVIANLPVPDPTQTPPVLGMTGLFMGDIAEIFYNGVILNPTFVSPSRAQQVMG